MAFLCLADQHVEVVRRVGETTLVGPDHVVEQVAEFVGVELGQHGRVDAPLRRALDLRKQDVQRRHGHVQGSLFSESTEAPGT